MDKVITNQNQNSIKMRAVQQMYLVHPVETRKVRQWVILGER